MKFFFKKRELLLRENFILKNFFQYFNNKCINNDKEKNLLSHSAILNFVLKEDLENKYKDPKINFYYHLLLKIKNTS